MATISDIAARAGVSPALVSRVLNGRTGVSPENRERILAVIREFNYRPNTLARSLVLQRTQTIGVVLDTLCMPYFFDLIYGLQDTGEQLGYNVIFGSGRDNARIKANYIDYFGSGRADGLIVYGSQLNDQNVLRDLAQRNTCFVLIEGRLPDASVHNLLVDNFTGARQATDRLIAADRRRIAHFTGDQRFRVGGDRLEGFLRAMEDAGLAPAAVVDTVFTEKSGYDAMAALLASGNVPDGLFCGSDRIAFGAMRALVGHGLHIPGDVAVVGFDDDLPQGGGQFPGLTTLRQPLRQMGSDAVRLLVETIEHPDREKVVKVYTPELVPRESCP